MTDEERAEVRAAIERIRPVADAARTNAGGVTVFHRGASTIVHHSYVTLLLEVAESALEGPADDTGGPAAMERRLRALAQGLTQRRQEMQALAERVTSLERDALRRSDLDRVTLTTRPVARGGGS